MRTKRKKPIIFIVIFAVIAAIVIYLFAFKYPTYKILDDTPYRESIKIENVVYQRSYWRADVFDQLIGFADTPEWGVYRSSDPEYSGFIMLKYHYALKQTPQPIMFKRQNSTLSEPCSTNITSITFYDYKRPSVTIHSHTLIEKIFNALDTPGSITLADLSSKTKYYGCIVLNNDKLPDLTFDLELLLSKSTNTYYLGIYNQNKLAPIPKELVKELKGYLK
jgi:hypothetical protein